MTATATSPIGRKGATPMRPELRVIDDVCVVRVGAEVRVHGYTSDALDGWCREVVTDLKRAGSKTDPAEAHYTPDGETTLGTVRELQCPDMTWEQFAAALVVLPCAAGCIEEE